MEILTKLTKEKIMATVTARKDKETKGTFRFSIEENADGISGSIYVSKETCKNPPDTISVTVVRDGKA
jgi:hypothetical protein